MLNFEPHPPNFENLFTFWRCSNDAKIFFDFTYWFQIFIDQCGLWSVPSISVAVLALVYALLCFSSIARDQPTVFTKLRFVLIMVYFYGVFASHWSFFTSAFYPRKEKAINGKGFLWEGVKYFFLPDLPRIVPNDK